MTDDVLTLPLPSFAPPARPRRWPRRVGVALLLLALAVGLSALSLSAWLPSPDGREVLARRIEEVVGGQIRGRLIIGGIDRFDDHSVAAHDVRFEDEAGHTVLEARVIDLDVDFAALAEGHFVSPRGHVHGGRVLLETLPSGELLVDRAFESAHPGAEDAPIGPDVVRLERLAADDIDVIVGLYGAPAVRITHASTICIVRAPENGGARLRAERIDATIRIEGPIPIDFEVDDGTVIIAGDAGRRARISLPARIGGEPMQVDLVVRMNHRDQVHVDVHLIPSSIGAVFTSAPLVAQALIAETLTDALDVTVDVR